MVLISNPSKWVEENHSLDHKQATTTVIEEIE